MNELPKDFRDLLADAGADFVGLGGHAVAFHGHPRATKDLDVLVRADPDNAAKVYRALAAFGAPLSSFEVREALITNKRAAGREQDLADVAALQAVAPRSSR